MANSLRAKISKLRHDGNITDAEYQDLIKKLDGHDAKVRADAIEEFKKYLLSHRRLVRDFETRNIYDAIKIEYVSDTTLEELKEQIE